jgi:DNA-binding response OmpR family regulator
VILDVALPGLDGFSICGQIREKKEIPIIFVSARTEEIDIIKGFKAGADDYVTKPFSPIELVARVNANVARYRRLLNINNDNEVIRIRGLEIDRTARRVFVDGEERSFTSREFDLLSFLAQNPNRVYSKEELFRNIWNMESVGGIATVTVHIKKIREKLSDDTDNPKYIETIWGVGYRFRM